MVANKQVLEFLNFFKGKISIILENYSSLVHISERFGSKISFEKLFLIPPLIESKYEKKKFPLNKKPLFKRKKNFLSVGALYYHKPSKNVWWQQKFNTIDYFPGRTLIHNNARRLGIDSYSIILEDYSKNNMILFRVFNKIANILGRRKIRQKKYYSQKISKIFSEYKYLFCPEDIFSVLPQFAFHALKSGLIIIGTNSDAYKSLGFEHGINYISIGDNWSVENISSTVTQISKSYNSNKLNYIHTNSRKHLVFLNEKTDKQIINLRNYGII